MKPLSKSAPYFSAYPLKVITDNIASSEPNLDPYLRALLESKTRPVSRARVFPMPNPYTTDQKTPAGPKHHSKNRKNIEPEGKEWFRNYE